MHWFIDSLTLSSECSCFRARLAGAEAASGDILIFLDSHCEATKGDRKNCSEHGSVTSLPFMKYWQIDGDTVSVKQKGSWESYISFIQSTHLELYWLMINKYNSNNCRSAEITKLSFLYSYNLIYSFQYNRRFLPKSGVNWPSWVRSTSPLNWFTAKFWKETNCIIVENVWQ